MGKFEPWDRIIMGAMCFMLAGHFAPERMFDFWFSAAAGTLMLGSIGGDLRRAQRRSVSEQIMPAPGEGGPDGA